MYRGTKTGYRDKANHSSMPPIHSLSLLQILNQILNSTHLNPPLLTKLQTPIPPHHPVLSPNLSNPLNNITPLNQLSNNTRRRLPSQLTEINRRLGMSRALAHTTRTRLKRDDMSRPSEGVDLRIWRRKRAAGQGAVLGRDSGRHGGVAGVDCNRVCGSFRVGVLGDHLWESEAGCEVRGDGGAY